MLCRTVLVTANGQHGLNPLVIKALGPLSHVYTRPGQAGNVTGYLACNLPVAERSGSTLRSAEGLFGLH